MSLLQLWRASREQFEGKHIQQIIAFAGGGRLRDGSSASVEFREFLANVPSETLIAYTDQCLQESFKDSGLALQDLVNQVGVRLGFEVEYGRYRRKFDGLWIFPDDHAVVVEVKTTDAYRIDLDRIAGYRRALINERSIDEEQSSVLIVVGRKDTGDLEAQIRGSRHAWDVRLISVDALIRLMTLKESLEEPQTIRRIHNILVPREFTRLDEIVEILFSATEEAKQEEFPETEEEIEEGVEEEAEAKRSPKAFHAPCVARIEEHLDTTLLKRVRTGYSSPDGEVAITCAVSKEYDRRGHRSYWFAFHPHQKEFIGQAEQGFAAFGCGSEENVILVPLDDLTQWLDDLWTTERDNGRTYWHIRIHFEERRWQLDRKKGKGRLDISQYYLR
jgi:hypothetical protein